MIVYAILYFISLLFIFSTPSSEKLDLAEISYIRSCAYIHEHNFISNLLLYSKVIYSLDIALRNLEKIIPEKRIAMLVLMARENLELNYHYLLKPVIANYKDKDLCISKQTRALVIPIENIYSLELIKFGSNFIPYIGDASLSNPGILKEIIEINFEEGILCIDCRNGRFVVLSENYDKKLAYFKVLNGSYKLELNCIIKDFIPKDLEDFTDYFELCE